MKAEYINQFRDCFIEIRNLESFVFSNPRDDKNRFLQSYLVMRCCGLIEFIFKSILYDSITKGGSVQIQKFFDTAILKSSTNPSPEKIEDILSKFDSSWGAAFRTLFEKGSKTRLDLKSLVDVRNAIAHGSAVTVPSVPDTKDKFISSCRIINFLSELLR